MKEKRQQMIRELIESRDVETQEELLDLLTKAGFKTTQATISRDIREMKLTKIASEKGKSKYTLMKNASTDVAGKYHQVLNAGILNIDSAENLIVIRTVSGMAMAVAAALDNMNLPGVMGCIAGDDTIFCAIRSHDYSFEIISQIRKVASDETLEV